MGSRLTLTPEQMVLQTPTWHELVDEEALFVLEAVANELHKVGVRQRSKVVHFSLHAHHRKHRVIYTEKKTKLARNTDTSNDHTNKTLHTDTDKILTSHSLWPWYPSWLSFLTAMTIPVPGLAGASVFSSTQPLKTEPNPPSPSTLSGLKFLVAVLSSLKLKALTLADSRISSSLRGVGSMDADDAWLLHPLRAAAAPFLLANLDAVPDDHQKEETLRIPRIVVFIFLFVCPVLIK
jgi:hypothetical protein